ncbi:hypothetical protein J3D46_005061 [Paenarthrobacter sp. A20]|nr:hypothetical protein [Paenarthrobacter sp. A20]
MDYENLETGGQAQKVLGQEAHIRARSAGGPRFDPTYEDVNGYNNLVLLCPNHHSMIDAGGGSGYTVDFLVRMKDLHEKNQSRRASIEAPLRAYLGDRYVAEGSVQFHQVNLEGPSVDSMFVDVPVGCRRDGTELANLVQQISFTTPGDTAELERTTGLAIAGATQVLLHPDWAGNAVLVGGPGQGKSTLLQYVCQFHRARRLGKTDYQTDSPATTETIRFPIKIDLRKYAQWADKNVQRAAGKKGKNKRENAPRGRRSIETYLIEDISEHIGAHKFTADDLVSLLATEPVLLALDGLDEVASVPARLKVIDEIVQMHGRLHSDASDLVILVATRPGSSLQTLTSSGRFPLLHLQRLTPGLRMQYFNRWCDVSGLHAATAARLQTVFMDSQHLPHVNELAAYPMQLAILLHLLHRRQLLPQQRTDLYTEYLKTFLDREQTQEKEPLLRQQRRVLEKTHAYLGWYLQTRAEEGKSSGSITRADLRDLLRNYLSGNEEEQALAEDIYSAITDRVLCLVERNDAFEFEVQSLREYFAAVHLFQNLTPKGTGNSRDDGLNALLVRPYWMNVCRFLMGLLAHGEIRGLMGNFNTASKLSAPHPLVRVMAAATLNDRICDDLGSGELREIVDFILEGPGVTLAHDGFLDSSGSPLVLGHQAGRSQAVAHLKSRLSTEIDPTMRAIVATMLRAHAISDDQVSQWWWENYQADSQWLSSAADLQSLQGLSEEQGSRIAALLKADSDPQRWAMDTLVEGIYDGNEEKIVEAAVHSLNLGAAETVKVRAVTTEVEALAALAEDMLTGPYKRRTPQTPRDIYAAKSQTTESIQRLTAELRLPPEGSIHPDDWAPYLGCIADAWGYGWILRRVLSMTPATLDLLAVRTRLQNEHLLVALQAESNYREHKSDAHWWQHYFASTSDPTELMLATVAVLEIAKPQVIVDIAEILNDVVAQFSEKMYRSLERALKRDSTSYRLRIRDLQEALRLQTVDLSGRMLWLVWIISNDSTRTRIRRHLEPKLHDVFEAGTNEVIVVLSAAEPAKKLRVETFRETRHALRAEGWLDPTRFAAITLGSAKSILEEPHSWPADIVQMAADKLGAKAAEQTKSLAEIATSASWFKS